MASRLCFVIMPFSATPACTEAEWTQIFAEVIKPTVEGAPGLDYECRRSTATRGNLVRGIVQDLQAAHLVIADLTDRNANVFYELGVRHTLTDRTILIAQARDHIPFDLQAYASHVYDWRTEDGRKQFQERLRELLSEVDQQPRRPDNPVSDFLGSSAGQRRQPQVTDDRLETLETQILALGAQVARLSGGPGAASGLDSNLDKWLRTHSLFSALPNGTTIDDLANHLATARNEVLLKAFVRATEREFVMRLSASIKELNTGGGGNVSRNDIASRAAPFVAAARPIAEPVMQFALACVASRFESGVRACIHIAGALVSLSEQVGGGLRFAVGLPAYLGWELLLAMGAKAVDCEDDDTARLIITEPIEVQLVGGQFSFEPLWLNRKLFFPELFLGYADIGIRNVANAWADSAAIRQTFADNAGFQHSLVVFMALTAIRHADQITDDRVQFYPGYRLIPGAPTAFRKFRAHITQKPSVRSMLAKLMGEPEPEFIAKWPERAAKLNRARLGSDYTWAAFELEFPESLTDKPES